MFVCFAATPNIMSLQCLILFDENIHKVYYSGQLMKGTVLLTLAKDQPVKGIYLSIHHLPVNFLLHPQLFGAHAGIYIEVTGVAKCRWCEHVQQKRMTYRGSEIYLSAKKYFVGAAEANSSTSITILKGEHVYTFTCPLPKHLPTSFEGTFGSIRYKAEVTVNVAMWPDKSFAEGFTVIKSLDLNGLDGIRVSCCLAPRTFGQTERVYNQFWFSRMPSPSTSPTCTTCGVAVRSSHRNPSTFWPALLAVDSRRAKALRSRWTSKTAAI